MNCRCGNFERGPGPSVVGLCINCGGLPCLTTGVDRKILESLRACLEPKPPVPYDQHIEEISIAAEGYKAQRDDAKARALEDLAIEMIMVGMRSITPADLHDRAKRIRHESVGVQRASSGDSSHREPKQGARRMTATYKRTELCHYDGKDEVLIVFSDESRFAIRITDVNTKAEIGRKLRGLGMMIEAAVDEEEQDA